MVHGFDDIICTHQIFIHNYMYLHIIVYLIPHSTEKMSDYLTIADLGDLYIATFDARIKWRNILLILYVPSDTIAVVLVRNGETILMNAIVRV